MIEIDGSHGEGGGQILRTSLTLSVLTEKPVRIHHIRAGRKAPGLKPQHLMSAKAAAQICGGRLTGSELGADELRFLPGRIRPGRYAFDVGTAGSTGLILQTLLLPLAFAGSVSRIHLKGGTHVAWSPPADYLQEVFLPAAAAMGIAAKMNLLKAGFYPIGGGEIEMTVEPCHAPLKSLRIKERGELKHLRVISTVANLPLSIAQRQMARAMARLTECGLQPRGESRSVESLGKGTFCFILAEFENVRAGFSALGEIGKRAERVAEEAVEAFLRYWNGTGVLDRHLADQLVLPMALADGESTVTLVEVTNHLKTNLWVTEHFLPVKFVLKEDSDGCGRLQVRGIGCRPG